MERKEIEERVKGLVSNALGVSEAEMAPESRLVGDLGAGSIDIIDISFQIEQEFEIEITPTEFWNMSDDLGNGEYFVDGQITEAGLETLRRRFVGFDRLGIAAGDSLLKLVGAFSISMIVDYIETKVA